MRAPYNDKQPGHVAFRRAALTSILCCFRQGDSSHSCSSATIGQIVLIYIGELLASENRLVCYSDKDHFENKADQLTALNLQTSQIVKALPKSYAELTSSSQYWAKGHPGLNCNVRQEGVSITKLGVSRLICVLGDDCRSISYLWQLSVAIDMRIYPQARDLIEAYCGSVTRVGSVRLSLYSHSLVLDFVRANVHN